MVWNYQVDMQVFQIDTFCQKNNFFLAQITFSCFGKYHKNFLSHVTFDIQLFWNIHILARYDNKNSILGCLKSRFYNRFCSKTSKTTNFELRCCHCDQNVSKYHQKPKNIMNNNFRTVLLLLRPKYI